MPGPISNINTKTEAISLDISRKLNWGNGITLAFKTPDPDDVSKLQTLLVLTKGFDRIVDDEETKGTGREVKFRVADLTGDVTDIIRTDDLYIDTDGELFAVDTVPKVGPNEAVVYEITCKTRTLRDKFFE